MAGCHYAHRSSCLFLWMLWPHYWVAIGFAAQLVFFLAVAVVVCTISVTEHGVVLYRINRLQWSEIKDVKPYSVFGLPYLRITRTKGFKWALPLYLRSLSAFYLSIIANAPLDNPLRTFAESALRTASARR